jgi:hypothetical protein
VTTVMKFWVHLKRVNASVGECLYSAEELLFSIQLINQLCDYSL